MENISGNNEFLYKMSVFLHKGLADVQAKVNDLYRVEELEDYVGVKDSPIEHIQAALGPLLVQAADLRDFSELQTGRMRLDLDEVDIDALMDGVLAMADELAEHKGGIVIEADVEEKLPAIEGDAARLSQALMHYIHNAIKFTQNGTITVRVARDGQNILFEVRDMGIGIAPEDQEKVFEAFETILEDKNDARLGLGLGLKIVEGMIDLHDGETWFESQAGRGSSFFFTIPL